MSITVYIQDQSHDNYEAQPNEVIGFSVQVVKNGKVVDGMHCRTKEQAEKMAQAFYKDNEIRKAWNNNK